MEAKFQTLLFPVITIMPVQLIFGISSMCALKKIVLKFSKKKKDRSNMANETRGPGALTICLTICQMKPA